MKSSKIVKDVKYMNIIILCITSRIWLGGLYQESLKILITEKGLVSFFCNQDFFCSETLWIDERKINQR